MVTMNSYSSDYFSGNWLTKQAHYFITVNKKCFVIEINPYNC